MLLHGMKRVQQCLKLILQVLIIREINPFAQSLNDAQRVQEFNGTIICVRGRKPARGQRRTLSRVF